ncbi:hypothetical protein O8E88_000978 [Flavobacterium psychrophilum]|uniref:hypothetical protein n=1 Tax=Flavobacterium psychrophilum TaxID=96345 RepID=UPI0004F89C1D|nr:hypothetical protein [Flavobacterium psychrophilum]AIN75030.1 hypothetical protein FPG3_00250 [Flavobacterium psychrophilum FPG3]EKT2069184.1 hypothetical protein [Flavobacterium psychrophilum]EKT2071281.1 hypothetical protein [Flavobacterium psychrophilum]EKT3963168.1 hypothetical protein [Flavobacterium psychrophilum]EKT3966061.1 hypothetical protein [Flavobacterium psychrophilum]
MKKLALLLATLIVLSCSKNEPEDLFKNYLTVDYDVDFYAANRNNQIEFNDLTITSTNDVYLLLDDRTNSKALLSKVSSNGAKSEVLNNLRGFLGNGINITSTLNDKLFFNSDGADNRNKIFSYDNIQLNSYVMIDNGPNYINKAQNTAMSRYSNNSIVVFDNNNKTLKFYLPENNLESTIAGSGNASVVDGNGLSASFKSISKIVCRDNKIYVIDDYTNLRKIEFINNAYKVTTLVSNYNSTIEDIAIDSNNDIYASVNGQGILKLNNTTNTFESFKTGSVNTITPDKTKTGFISWSNGVTGMYINENDLYILNGVRLIKISNFKSKI